MATAASYFDRKPSSSVRPGLSHLQPEPASPHTPPRNFPSTFSSPSVSYRAEEEALVFEFGTRHLNAGFAGESYPRCKLGFGPDQSLKVGDYRRWLPGYEDRPRKRRKTSEWGKDHELWRMDLRGFDLGIVEDKIERAVREAYNKYLLLDSKSRKLFLILPSVMPHQLLDTVLSTLFENFQIPTITLLSPPVLTTVSAGCRSSLIVDIGWRESVVTAVYEYREISQFRTTRAMRLVTLEMAKVLDRYDQQTYIAHKGPGKNTDDGLIAVDLDQAEEVAMRMAWCKSRDTEPKASTAPDDIPSMDRLFIADDDVGKKGVRTTQDQEMLIEIPSPSSPRKSIKLPFSALAVPAETSLLHTPPDPHELDDHDQPLHLLIYKALLHLPPDVRSLSMPRIIITGGGSNIPGLKQRLLDEVSALIKERGWDPVYGKAANEQRRRLQEISSRRQASKKLASSTGIELHEEPSAIPASEAAQTPDPTEEKLRKEQAKRSKPTVAGVVRGVETWGAWAGGSLLAGLRIKGIVEIDKDVFLQSGLAGARKDAESGAQPSKSHGAGMPRTGMGERTNWTLGGWA